MGARRRAWGDRDLIRDLMPISMAFLEGGLLVIKRISYENCSVMGSNWEDNL